MKNSTLFLLVSLLFIACGNEPQSSPDTATTATATTNQEIGDEASTREETTQAALLPATDLRALKGYYVGRFEATANDFYEKDGVYANKITVSIDEVRMDNEVEGYAKGHSVVAGNQRPFEGAITKSEEGYSISAKEPGDDRYDGHFVFTIAPDAQSLEGLWNANDKNLAVPQRKYELMRKTFAYNKDQALPIDVKWGTLTDDNMAFLQGIGEVEAISEEVLKYNASNTKLNKEDIENLFKGDLEIIRNAIYARHGYSFKNRRMRFIFDHLVDWYIPVSTDIRAELTDLEKENIELLKRYEQHAEKYYDYYGR